MNTGLRFKVGDKVRIKSREWFDAYEDMGDYYHFGTFGANGIYNIRVPKSFAEFGGSVMMITQICTMYDGGVMYRLDALDYDVPEDVIEREVNGADIEEWVRKQEEEMNERAREYCQGQTSGSSELKYKVGDKVRIKPRKWFEENVRPGENGIRIKENGLEYLYSCLFGDKCCGEVATIVGVVESGNGVVYECEIGGARVDACLVSSLFEGKVDKDDDFEGLSEETAERMNEVLEDGIRKREQIQEMACEQARTESILTAINELERTVDKWIASGNKYKVGVDTGDEGGDKTSVVAGEVGGSHYQMAIQPVEFIMANDIPFCEGNVIKYVCRHRRKNGAEDIRKAIHYLEIILEKIYNVKKDKEE